VKGIYNIRTLFEKYYSEYGNYIDAAAKFVTALILFMQINGRIGGKSIFGNIFVELILALICAILPPNVMIVLAFVAALLQFASVSIASLAVGGGVLLAVLLLYFAFASRQAWAMLLTILGLFFHVPCIVPISFGLMGSTMSAAGMAAGTVFYYTLLTIGKLGGASVDLAMAKQSTAEKILAELQTMIDTLLGEQEMILMLVVLLAVFAVVFLTRRMAMKHAWKVAIAAGTVIYLVLMMAGYMMLHLEIGILWILIGTLISAAVAFLLEQLFFNLDYRKIENLQFEDNDYYYYVEAVPTMRTVRKWKQEESTGKDVNIMMGMKQFIHSYLSSLTFTYSDVLEIIILSFVVYHILIWIRNTRAWTLMKGILVMIVFIFIATLLNLDSILFLVSKGINAILVATAVIFQPELRRALEQLGEKKFLSSLIPFDMEKDAEERFSDKTVNELVKGSFEMGKAKTGALIVLEKNTKLTEYIRTGIELDSLVTSQLLLNIFEHNTPLHDGAIIVRGNRIISATCYLPLSDNMELSKELGTRHRAGVGISEVTDSLTIIVSEETGNVSIAQKGVLTRDVTPEELKEQLVILQDKNVSTKRFKFWKGKGKNEENINQNKENIDQ